MEDKRVFQRVLFSHDASLVHKDKKLTIQVLDLSLDGFLCNLPTDNVIELNDEVTLELQLEKNRKIVMASTVVHIKKSYLGVKCNHIDIDSISELKRLIQLNLANDDLLNRELSGLAR